MRPFVLTSPAAASLRVVAVRPGLVFPHADLRGVLDMNGYTSADVLESDIAYQQGGDNHLVRPLRTWETWPCER